MECALSPSVSIDVNSRNALSPPLSVPAVFLHDTRSKRNLLPQLLDRVVWDHAAREITLDIKDDAVERLGTAFQTQTDSEKDLQ